MTVNKAKAQRENNERLRLALLANNLGMWELDLVHGKRHFSEVALALHGLKGSSETVHHVELTDQVMHPDDRLNLKLLHTALREGLDDYAFEYRTFMPDGEMRWISAHGKVLERQQDGPTSIIGVCTDITLQKQKQLVQEQNDHRFRGLADSLPQLVWIADGGGHITYYNERRMLYFEAVKTKAVKPQWQPLIHPDDLPQTIATWAKSMRSGEEYDMEHRLRMADGTYRWHLSRATSVRGIDGKVSVWFGTATDIDRLKLSEIHIQAGVERLQVATEAADMFAWEINFETGELGWADNAAAVIGCSPEISTSNRFDGNFFVHPDDRQRLSDEFEGFRQKGDERFEMDFRGLPKAGQAMFWRTAGKFLRNAQGVVDRAVGITQNVTSHVESTLQVKLLDERLRATEEGARALVYDWDVVANYVWRSPGLERTLGWAQHEIASDAQGWYKLIHPDDLAHIQSGEKSDMLDADDHYAKEYRVRHKNGSYHWMMDSGRVFRDSSGTIIRQVGTTIDISMRKSLEMSQQRMLKLIDLSFEPIFVWQAERGILEWNRGAELLYGYSRDEAIGKQPMNFLKTRYPVASEELLNDPQDTRDWSGEIENFDRHGNMIVVESRRQIIKFDDEAMVLETNRDIRERKRADTQVARMAAVAAASHDALYGTNLQGMIEAWNPGAVKLFGYEEAEAVGQHVSLLVFPEQHAEQLDFLLRVGAGETIKPFDTLRKTKDDSIVNVSMAISPVTATNGTVVGISVAIHDIGERKEWEKLQRFMNRELAHRVKNSFAILQAILRSTLKSSPDPEKFAAAFSGRLHSMAAAHDVLTANDWRGAELGTLLRHQLSYFVNGQRIHLTGGILNITAEYAAPLSLIFNELATNALKYGALSADNGRIDVGWEISCNPGDVPSIVLTWTETGGPKIDAVGARSFGTTLIEKSFAEATVNLDLQPDGLICKITWPVSPIRRPAE